MAATRSARDLTQGPVFRHILRMVLPMSLGIVAMMLVGVVDAYWVGRLGTAQQAAVQFVFPVSMLVMSVAIGLGAGAVSVVARAAGRGDHGRTRRVATDAVTLSFIVVAIVAALGVALIDPLFRALGATEAMMPFVREYMVIWFAGIVFMVGPMVAGNILRALGDAVIPSLIMVAAAVINMILDPILIFGWGPVPRMEVQGAALATLIANLSVFVMAMAIIIWREKLIDFSFPGWSELLWNWREIARIGVPAAGSNTIGPLANTAVFAAAAGFGEPAVAGLGVGMRVEALAIIPLFALSGSIGPITGQNGGAGLTHRVREAFAKSFLFCLGWGLFVAVVMALLSPLLAPAFLPGEDGQAMARAYWLIAPFAVAGYGVAMAASAGFNGLGRPLLGVAVNLFRGLALVAPLAWLGALWGGATGVIWGLFAANMISGLVIAAVVLRLCPLTAVDGRARRASPPASPLSAGSGAPPAPASHSAPDGDKP
ncbi:MATE family efflux transporter [Alkalicaulis satelles]|uniref:MATE family efflux transporter n=1 Tax=Alkalicaulis satelles TaxID=2609175 RepID=A0A5M6ZLZ7_9PROT|nr:MATE family efflux transporter [Alkalicaulis satelles]KAA5805350.1 MATE family efflux transporter [Alkalicaulis satelles]